MNHWFIGDGVIVRYERDVADVHPGGRRLVRVTPEWPTREPSGRRYSVVLMEGKRAIQGEARDDLVSALQLGEEWVP